MSRIRLVSMLLLPLVCVVLRSAKQYRLHPSIHLRRLLSHSELEVVCDTLAHSARFFIVRRSSSTVSPHESRSSCSTYVMWLACPLSILPALPSHKNRRLKVCSDGNDVIASGSMFKTLAGFPLSCLQKIPGLSRTPKTFFQDLVVAQQC